MTGLLGPGDVARVCGLIAADPSFDRAAEDKENRRAGRRLGLSGDPDYWTWEDWMRVDAERNAAPACYACFLFAPVPPSEVAGRSATDWDDPRILAGTWGTDSNCSRYSLEAANLYTDYELRAMVILSVDYHLNATDLVEAYEIVLENLFTVGGSVLPVETYWPIVVKRGGYVPMPDNAHPDDQIFSVYVGAMAVVRHGPPMLQEAMFNRLDSAILEWQSDLANRRSAESLGEWLRSNGAADW